MKDILLIATILLTATIVNAGPTPYVPEVDARFTAIESVNTTQTSNIATNTAALVTENSTNAIKSVVATYDFAVDGGAVGAIASSITIPDNAIITQAYMDVITPMASAGNAGTIAVHAQGANDLTTAVDADTLSGIVAGIPVGTAATAIKLTAARVVTFTIAVEDLTAGKFHYIIEYAVDE